MFKRLATAAVFALLGTAASATTFTSTSAFEAELESLTRIDTSSFIGQTTSNIPVSGGSFFGPDALVRSDDYILNGFGFHGSNAHVGLNFTGAVNAVGVTTSPRDGGRMRLFSGLNGTGTLIQDVNFGGVFTGVISSSNFASVIFTCDFDSDRRCGLRDPVFGLDSADLQAAPVPLPATGLLLAAGLGGLAALRRRASS